MTGFRSTKPSDIKEDHQWTQRLGKFGGRLSGRHRQAAVESCVSGSSGNSTVTGDSQTRPSKRFGIRQLASDSHLRDSASFGTAAPSVTSTRTPSVLSDRSYRSGQGPMAGMLDTDRTRTRRERTFVGSKCAVCEELLEHTLRGERVLQFSCGHVSHEACFYEYIKEEDAKCCPDCEAPLGLDSSRGGNVLDLEKLSSIVRSVSIADGRDTPGQRDIQRDSHRDGQRDSHRERDRETVHSVPGSYDPYARARSRQGSRTSSRTRESRTESRNDIRDSVPRTLDSGHWRNNSTASASDCGESLAVPHQRRHDYDVQSMEGEVRPSSVAHPIPPPTVTVKSEFPTITRSKVQQSLTCLVTVEVHDRKSNNFADDVPFAPSAPFDRQYQPSSPTATSQYSFEGQEPVPVKPERDIERQREQDMLANITEELRLRVENWHGLDFNRFGKLRLHGTIKVGKDCQAWQELECFLFSEMLICVKEKKINPPPDQWTNGAPRRKSVKCTLKGSILIKKHLKKVSDSSGSDDHILTLNLSVDDLPQFHLSFPNHGQLEQWHRALLDLHSDVPGAQPFQERQTLGSEVDDDDYRTVRSNRVSSAHSAHSGTHGGSRSVAAASSEYSTASTRGGMAPSRSVHIPLDMVIVIPVSSSMQGLKISLLKDTLRFLVHNLGDRDRLALVTFGSSGGGVPLTGLTTKDWPGWHKTISSIRPVGQKSLRSDIVEGANVAMDLLMQRKASNPVGSILLISDSSTSEGEVVDFVVSRAEAAKISIHSFGLGQAHKPDTMIELSNKTKGQYTYVKDWMMLRECVAGCVGSLQTLSHQNAKLKLRLPEGSSARLLKVQGGFLVSKRSTGREVEISIGDLRFGDRKDVIVQLAIDPDTTETESAPQDAWESIVSGLEELGGSLDQDEPRTVSVEEVPLIMADLMYSDIQRAGTLAQSRPHLLTITMLPPASPNRSGENSPNAPPIPPHPLVVQRRMELLTADMLGRALTLVSKNRHEDAQRLLKETRTILRGLGKGGLPPLPPAPGRNGSKGEDRSRSPAKGTALESVFSPGPGVDPTTVAALESELDSALEWINHPAVFSRDSRKAVLQAVGVISSQRGITFRTQCESLYANRISGVKQLSKLANDWRDPNDSLMEED